MEVIPVILAGGAGTRLWPLSRNDKPKQFHNLSGKGSLLTETIMRLRVLQPRENIIVGSAEHKELSRAELLKNKIKCTLLCEPCPKNTAAAVLYAAMYLKQKYRNSLMITLPADHYIPDNDKFINIIKKAIPEAETGRLVTLGIRPRYPETGYGYIQSSGKKTGRAYKAGKFIEKPDIKKAKKYASTEGFFWNSGIYIWKVSAILESFSRYLPDLYEDFAPLAKFTSSQISSDSKKVWPVKKKIFQQCKSVSIDKGIMEQADNVSIIPADFHWTDLGSWKSLDEIVSTVDRHGNRSPSPDNAVFLNSKNCTVYSEGRKISIVGLSDVAVVEAGDNILIINKEKAQDLKDLIEIINNKE